MCQDVHGIQDYGSRASMTTIFTVMNSSRTFLKACETCQLRSKNFRRYQKPDKSDGLRATSWQVLCCLMIMVRMLMSFRVIMEITSTFKKCFVTDTGRCNVFSLLCFCNKTNKQTKKNCKYWFTFFQQMYVHGSQFINSWSVLMDCKSVLMLPGCVKGSFIQDCRGRPYCIDILL